MRKLLCMLGFHRKINASWTRRWCPFCRTQWGREGQVWRGKILTGGWQVLK